MRQAAHYDLHTTEGLAQVQHLRFILPSGEVDTQYNGMTIRGGVLVDVIQDMPGSEVVDGRCALQLPRLAAGCHRYDVLVSDDGTDKPLLAGVIHVAPRVTPVDLDDNAPADYLDIVIPEDEGGTITVISESPAWVDDAVEKSLQERGMYVSPTSGTVSMSPPGYDQDQTVAWSWARFRFGDDMLGGYRGSVCKVRDVYMWSVIGTTDTTPRWLDIWRRAPGGDWVLAARSGQAVASSTDVDLYMWGMIAETEIVIGDEVALHVYSGTPEAPVELPLSIARQMVTATDGRGIASALDGPITDASVMPAVMLSCTYQDGVSVGGVNLATRAEVARVKDYADNVNKEVYASARQVEGIVSDFTQTVSNAKQAISAAEGEAITAIQAKQADSVLAVGRASQTAQQNITSVQNTAVLVVQNAQQVAEESLAGTVKEATDARTDAEGAAERANASATAAQEALSAIPQVDAGGNMTLAGGLTTAATINANGGVRSTAVLSVLENMMTLGGGYAAKAFDLSGYVDLRSIAFANAVNVSKLHYPYLMDKDTVIFHETVTGNNFLSYPVIVFDRYCFAWGTFPPSSTVLSMGGSYMKYEIGEHNAFMGFALGQTSIAAQSVSEVGPPYIYLKMYSRANEQTTFSVYYNIGDGDRVFTQAGLTRPINRLFLICEWVDTTSMRVSVGVVYGTSNLGVTSRQVTIYRMGVIAVDYYAVGEKVIPFFSSNTTVTSITDMRRALGLSIHPGMLITDYFATSN